MGLRTGIDGMERRKTSLLRGLEIRALGRSQLVTNRYTNCAIPGNTLHKVDYVHECLRNVLREWKDGYVNFNLGRCYLNQSSKLLDKIQCRSITPSFI
jgi:hypothetical protein